MTAVSCVQHDRQPDAPRPREPAHPWIVLVVLLLTGLPQLALAVGDGVVPDEDQRLRPVRRMLLLDRALGGRITVAPVRRTPVGTHVGSDTRQPTRLAGAQLWNALQPAQSSVPRPHLWLRRLMSVLYRHHTNYV